MSKGLLDLPQEMLDQIVSYLDMDSLQKTGKVCEKLCNIVSRPQVSFAFFSNLGQEKLKENFKQFCQINTFPKDNKNKQARYFFEYIVPLEYSNPDLRFIPKEKIASHPTLKPYCQKLTAITLQNNINLLGKINAFFKLALTDRIHSQLIGMISKDSKLFISEKLDEKNQNLLYAICVKTIPFLARAIYRKELRKIALQRNQGVSQQTLSVSRPGIN